MENMKSVGLSIITMLLCILSIAQAPQKMSYQVVIRNAGGEVVKNQAVGMQISILQGSATGTPVYVETHTPTINANGLASLEIGGGAVVTGTLAGIDWSAGPYFLKTETDPAGGTSYTITGTSQLLSVPYAFNAKTAETSANGAGLTQRINILEDNLIAAGTYKLADIDGNQYNVIKIGTNIWMKENLKTTKYNDGSPIDYPGNDFSAWTNNTTGAYAWYNNDEATYKGTYGALYNWFAAKNDKLCPTGWHVPTDAELTTLQDYLIANGFNYDGTIIGNKIAKSLASTTGWTSSTSQGAPGNTDYPAFRNKSGFAALPGGYRSSADYAHLGQEFHLWSSTTSMGSHWNIVIFCNFYGVNRRSDSPYFGYSVRCLKD
jgi:uncharacterized protein (TIGR02145 family)